MIPYQSQLWLRGHCSHRPLNRAGRRPIRSCDRPHPTVHLARIANLTEDGVRCLPLRQCCLHCHQPPPDGREVCIIVHHIRKGGLVLAELLVAAKISQCRYTSADKSAARGQIAFDNRERAGDNIVVVGQSGESVALDPAFGWIGLAKDRGPQRPRPLDHQLPHVTMVEMQ